jgi:NAD(P)-dependent dehydrogenase (short-subunit alcohol dehydrogenase family)
MSDTDEAPNAQTGVTDESSRFARLRGRRILVVGASSGIGRSIAVTAARSGAVVSFAARRRDLVEEAVAEAREGSDSHVRARGFGCDLTDESSTGHLVEAAAEWMGGIDVLVQAAGVASLGRIEKLDRSDWTRMLLTNLVGPARVVAAALPELREAENPTVVLLSTHTVGVPWPAMSAYSATKAALEELGRGLRVEEPGLRVVSVRVGNTMTGFSDGWEADGFDAAMREWLEKRLFRHKVLPASEVAATILDAVADPDGPTEFYARGDEIPESEIEKQISG